MPVAENLLNRAHTRGNPAHDGLEAGIVGGCGREIDTGTWVGGGCDLSQCASPRARPGLKVSATCQARPTIQRSTSPSPSKNASPPHTATPFRIRILILHTHNSEHRCKRRTSRAGS